MVKLQVNLLYRFATHWEGGYTKQSFDRSVLPILTRVNAIIVKDCVQFTGAAGRIYHVTFDDVNEAVQWRRELTNAIKLLHRKSPVDFQEVKWS